MQEQINLEDFLVPERILILKGKQDKDDVLNALIDRVAETTKTTARDDIARGIFHRESLMDTGIGNGIAVPHCRIEEIDESCVATAIIPEGIQDYQAPDKHTVRLIFLIVSAGDAKTLHIKLVSNISQLFFDGRIKAAWLAANDPQTCIDILHRLKN